jgi:hypothetical protein
MESSLRWQTGRAWRSDFGMRKLFSISISISISISPRPPFIRRV